jgi:hypothetical protein
MAAVAVTRDVRLALYDDLVLGVVVAVDEQGEEES